ncbi:MAG: hypothetical protein R3F07_01060 [Opitutaceae bacterium]
MNELLLRTARISRERPQFDLASLTGVLTAGFIGLASIKPGARIAVAAGSRGIANIAEITIAVVDLLKRVGAKPFIFPAMGSHGGATGPGQAAVLAAYGITEASAGCPILSSMEVIELDSSGLEHPLFLDAHAAGADGIVLINRIKPHTDFHGRHESGLAKMSVIGLGKRRQAETMHGYGVHGLRDLTPVAAAKVLRSGRILCGIGIVENAFDETAQVEVIPAHRILEREPELLEVARANMPRLPVEQLDVLIVDEMGKDISGCGMDTNVIGRLRIPGEPEFGPPHIRGLVVCDLTEASHGNALGTGLADVITRRLAARIDEEETYTNVVTSGFLERGNTPLVAPTDAEAYRLALRTCGRLEPGSERVMRIRNTLHTSVIQASAAVVSELDGRADVEWISGYQPAFDGEGNLSAWPEG